MVNAKNRNHMQFKFFSCLTDILDVMAGGVKSIIRLPKAEREAIRHTLTGPYRVNQRDVELVDHAVAPSCSENPIDNVLLSIAIVARTHKTTFSKHNLKANRKE